MLVNSMSNPCSSHPCLASSRHKSCRVSAASPFHTTWRSGEWQRSLRLPAASPAWSAATCSARWTTAAALTTPQSMLEYVCKQPNLMEYLHPGVSHTQPSVVELTDGKLNHVFHIYSRDSSRHLIVKHAPPYAKCLGDALRLSQERLRIEMGAMHAVHCRAPNHVPKIYHYDAEQSVMAMQFLEAPHTKVKLFREATALPHGSVCLPSLSRLCPQVQLLMNTWHVYHFSPEQMLLGLHHHAHGLSYPGHLNAKKIAFSTGTTQCLPFPGAGDAQAAPACALLP
ncbi:hypothetical protein DUNSADRAFT_2974 [Dunaliella salina]|uniref:Aminoglycoside phosphotransferase domain-containing protein n=1 Tax=Dunaliella salina TaxID=3046 RepID=A0ABQ7GUS3_DUNSA|nr:hypothetical protein DUNSADRAFT_2974 [Dunaliella salina]|eukprot:KAF5838364.1 hypothetical protein DUNSADRAFT_2974 [Dunaliella salina]